MKLCQQNRVILTGRLQAWGCCFSLGLVPASVSRIDTARSASAPWLRRWFLSASPSPGKRTKSCSSWAVRTEARSARQDRAQKLDHIGNGQPAARARRHPGRTGRLAGSASLHTKGYCDMTIDVTAPRRTGASAWPEDRSDHGFDRAKWQSFAPDAAKGQQAEPLHCPLGLRAMMPKVCRPPRYARIMQAAAT